MPRRGELQEDREGPQQIGQETFSQCDGCLTEEINQALFDNSILEATKEAVIEVATEMGCDAILLPAVLGSETHDHWNAWTDYKTGQTFTSNVHSAMSTAQILIITQDGKLLMKGQAQGESYLQSDPTYFAESQFERILNKATKK